MSKILIFLGWTNHQKQKTFNPQLNGKLWAKILMELEIVQFIIQQTQPLNRTIGMNYEIAQKITLNVKTIEPEALTGLLQNIIRDWSPKLPRYISILATIRDEKGRIRLVILLDTFKMVHIKSYISNPKFSRGYIICYFT